MRTILAFVLLCSTAFGQSIVISGGQRSMIVSGSAPAVQVQQVTQEVETKTKVKVTPKKVVTKTETTVETRTQPVNRADYVVVFTTTNCSPCQMMKTRTIPVLKQRGIRVVEISDPRVAAQYGVTAFPVVMVAQNARQKKRWTGYVNAETLLQYVTTSSTESAVRSLPFRDSSLFDGQPGSSHQNRETLIQHLIDLHGQSRGQLNGLSDMQLNDLHNQQHPVDQKQPFSNLRMEPQTKLLPRCIDYQGTTIDLATYSRTDKHGNPCQCGMCLWIYPQQNAYLEQQRQLEYTKAEFVPAPGQDPTPMDLVKSGVDLMQDAAGGFLIDIGCGDARWLIAFVQRYGGTATGIEIDAEMVAEARRQVAAAGLDDRIEIIEGDARSFDYSVADAIVAHLYEDLLIELQSAGAFSNASIVVAPYHEIPGLGMRSVNGVWIKS